jgi:hypothetical protein
MNRNMVRHERYKGHVSNKQWRLSSEIFFKWFCFNSVRRPTIRIWVASWPLARGLCRSTTKRANKSCMNLTMMRNNKIMCKKVNGKKTSEIKQPTSGMGISEELNSMHSGFVCDNLCLHNSVMHLQTCRYLFVNLNHIYRTGKWELYNRWSTYSQKINASQKNINQGVPKHLP